MENSYKKVDINNEFMLAAKNFAHEHSLDHDFPTGSVVVLDNKIIGSGANGSDYHTTHGCDRKKQNMPTGVGYELCEGCHPKNHSEPRAIQNAKDNGYDTKGADLYLWGHFWCCEPCMNAIISGGIRDVYLLQGSEILFDRTKEGNIVGHQFEE